MDEHPDSSLQILENIPTAQQFRGLEQADYALLLTQARSRCRITATSDSLIRIAIDFYEHSNNQDRKTLALYYLSDVYTDMGKYVEAIVPLKQAEEALKEIHHTTLQSLIYSKLGYLNRKSGNYALAFSYYAKAMKIDKSNQKIEWLVSDLINILNLPLTKIQDSASVYIKQLEDIVSNARPDLQAKAFNNIGVYYEDIQQKELAIEYYQKAIKTSASTSYRAYSNLARIYEDQGYIARADSLFQSALQTPVWATKANIYESLSKRYFDAGNYLKVIEFLKRYQAATDSFYTLRQAQNIQDLQAKYDNEVLVRSKTETENRLYRIILGGIGLFLCLLAGNYWLYYQRKRHLKLIQECISEIEILTDEKKNAEFEITQLNQILSQSNALRDEVMLAKGQWTSLNDIRALGLYTRLCQNLQYYNSSSDYSSLLHWTNITSNHFANRIIEKYPHLNNSDITLCCLSRMGYSISQIAEILHVKPASINRYIYRACTSLGIPNKKESFHNFTLSF